MNDVIKDADVTHFVMQHQTGFTFYESFSVLMFTLQGPSIIMQFLTLFRCKLSIDTPNYVQTT